MTYLIKYIQDIYVLHYPIPTRFFKYQIEKK